MSGALQIDYVEFPATDLNAVQAFYEQVFGWQFTDYGPDYKSFADGRLNGGFFSSSEKSQTQSGGALIVLYAADLETVRDAVSARGGQISKDIFSFPGGRRFQFLDPHGNELAVWSDQERPAPSE
ncbi:MAG: VOC family protein [Planctomycetaceae bacterium]|nr:VOC family protein [Planctomycetaceae bacterium]